VSQRRSRPADHSFDLGARGESLGLIAQASAAQPPLYARALTQKLAEFVDETVANGPGAGRRDGWNRRALEEYPETKSLWSSFRGWLIHDAFQQL